MMFDWLTRDRTPPEYYLVRATIKRINTTDELRPFDLTEELRLIKARSVREASSILNWHVDARKTSWCIYVVENARFEEALT